MFGQAIELKPGSNGFVMIPNVSSLGTCTNTDKGKIIYYSTDNSLRMCNGTTWLNISASTFSLPFALSGSNNSLNGIFKIENTATSSISNGIQGVINSMEGSAIYGVSNQATPSYFTYGVSGINNSTNGFGVGVYGKSDNGFGVNGSTLSGIAVYGTSSSGGAIRGLTSNGIGVYGAATSSSGIGGSFANSNGIALQTSGKLRIGGNGVGAVEADKFLKSTNTNGDAEWSNLLPYTFSGNVASFWALLIENTNTSNSVSPLIAHTHSTGSGSAISGISNSTNPSGDTYGISGNNYSSNAKGAGVHGIHSGSGSGVYGETGSGSGVYGYSISGIGIKGLTTDGTGGYFSSDYASNYALVTNIGKVGIGTTTPAAKMDIKGSAKFSHFYFGDNEDTYIRGGKTGSKVLINDEAGMGSVGIGHDNPNELLDVNGRMRIRHRVISSVAYSSGVWMSNSTNSLSANDGAFYGMKTDTEAGIYIGNVWRFWVNNAGNGYLNGNLIQTSDRRLKKEFSLINNPLSNIYKLNGYHYKWIEESRSKDLQTGLIAQEVQKIFPELVQTDEKGFLSVNYIGLVPHLIEAIKELRDENQQFKNQSEQLYTKVSEMEDLKLRVNRLEALLVKEKTALSDK